MKEYIDTYLDPSKAEYCNNITIEEIPLSLNIDIPTYYYALSLSGADDFEIHLKRSPDSCFINNYNPQFLIAWNANIDLQPVFNYYKASSYLCSYFSKNESETSQALIHAAKEIKEKELNVRQSMFKYACAYATSRSMSLQAVTFCLPDLWLRKCFPKTIFINTYLPDQRIRLVKLCKELNELDPESNDVFKRNSIDRYKDRPDAQFRNGKYAVIDKLCLAMFVAYYNPEPQPNITDDFQPNVRRRFNHNT